MSLGTQERLERWTALTVSTRQPVVCSTQSLPSLPLAAPVVARIPPQQQHPRQPSTHTLCEHQFAPVPIHDVGRLDVERNEQPRGVDQHVALTVDELLGPVVPARAADAGGLDRLAVDAAGTGLGGAPQADAEPLAQQAMDPFPGAVHAPFPEIVEDGLP